ncbi:RagB/SusD family nutrient uptake outer membrane protein [Dyadobacter fermentans]|jgi:starch-binding outer membrane protein, SusD/RagB family|uniref:RagB/SusD family nutrient uptake outer membrane protein n=1 Tax=Dyadobacter fermentans TaxID=94254 RepID=UPI001CBC4435|nr:RagB/SusD family nutrient uptake outer membrane protein [Dyadobacter fermentans]MBZ1359020.1 RagB/SusD family nutrient uptake outer membrane protein [Dyadobacter fermentans]
MKLTYKFLLVAALMTGGLSSCDTDFLDVTPPTEIAGDAVWGDGALSESFVTGIYAGLQQGGFSEQMLASLTDEAVFTHTGRNINTVNEGSLSPSNLGWVDATYGWSQMYQYIRASNLAISRLATATFTDETLKARLKGEAYFMRAYYYQQLVRYYGGVPLIKKVYALNEDYSVPRNTYDECVKQIVSDADSAALLLDGKNPAKGRATKTAALALKARVLLYAASDLHDIPTAKANSPVIAAFPNPEFLGYTSGDRKARWTAAQAAAKAALDASGNGYKLNLTAPVTAEQGRLNYISLAMSGASADKSLDASANEIIFGRYFTPSQNEGARQTGLNNGPNGYHNWAGNTPIGTLVDDYEMMDGTPFSWTNPTHKANPYVNRDPRFYATIMYDGANWKPRPSDAKDPANQIQTGAYDLLDDKGALINRKGLDTRSSSIEDWNGSRTGYYMRKFIDPNPSLYDNTDRQNIPWPFFRVTENVFNYIEASIELGEEAVALEWLNKIRFRAGMPALKVSGAALKEAFRHEKRIEMAYEEQRYHDARRWMVAPTTLGRSLQYINVIGKFKPGKSMKEPYHYDPTVYDYTYTPVEEKSHENRTWVDKMYFRPFSRDEINRNAKLVQNPGYDK